MKKKSSKSKSNFKSDAPNWYVLANRTDAVMYADGEDREFHFLNRLSNPKGADHESGLDSDRSGQTSSGKGGTVHHALDRHHQRHEALAQKFAKRIAKALSEGHQTKQFDKLVLVAEPHFLGLLRKELPAAVLKKVSHEVTREYIRGSDLDLRLKVFQAMGKK